MSPSAVGRIALHHPDCSNKTPTPTSVRDPGLHFSPSPLHLAGTMAAADTIDKSPQVAGEATEFEDIKKGQGAQENIAHYLPATDEEKALDKTINRKLDFTVLLILAISFIVGFPNPSPPS